VGCERDVHTRVKVTCAINISSRAHLYRTAIVHLFGSPDLRSSLTIRPWLGYTLSNGLFEKKPGWAAKMCVQRCSPGVLVEAHQ
jgi:hypothetical protein